ncbi:MAG: hypothetical protein O2954_07265 [bacterium]|nr:hypothetical protein [bacterium]
MPSTLLELAPTDLRIKRQDRYHRLYSLVSLACVHATEYEGETV